MFHTLETLLAHHERVIVIDVDDVICKHLDRDYRNALPNFPLIEKMRELKTNGFYFLLFTGRGMLSLKGDKYAIDRERRPVLEEWLETYSVPCDYLLMGKPLGLFYVDDKALRPDEFLSLEVENLGGASPARVERIGDKVVKYGYGVDKQERWYRYFSGILLEYRSSFNTYIPEIYSYMDNTLWMEYIPPSFPFTSLDFSALLSDVKKFKQISDRKAGCSPTFWTYMAHLDAEHRAAITEFERILPFKKLLQESYPGFNRERSFMHGDLTLSNVIHSSRNGRIYLIDPNFNPLVYSSWILDVGKLLQSVYLGYEEIILGQEIGDTSRLFKLVETSLSGEEFRLSFIALLTHLLRMRKYHQGFTEWIDAMALSVFNDLKNL